MHSAFSISYCQFLCLCPGSFICMCFTGILVHLEITDVTSKNVNQSISFLFCKTSGLEMIVTFFFPRWMQIDRYENIFTAFHDKSSFCAFSLKSHFNLFIRFSLCQHIKSPSFLGSSGGISTTTTITAAAEAATALSNNNSILPKPNILKLLFCNTYVVDELGLPYFYHARQVN